MSEPKKISRQQRRQMAKGAREQERLDAIRAEVEREMAETPQVNQGEVEEAALKKVCEELDMQVHEITPDGHCLYNAIADQMNVRYPSHGTYTCDNMRRAAASYMRQHADDFMPFISDLDESAAGVSHDASAGKDPHARFMDYCDAMEHTSAWGGQPEIMALSQVLHTPIHVVQAGSPIIKIGEDQFADKAPLWIAYHVKMYGLGEVRIHISHYSITTHCAHAPKSHPAGASRHSIGARHSTARAMHRASRPTQACGARQGQTAYRPRLSGWALATT